VLETAFTRLVGCQVPIQLAGMGSILSPELGAAVSNAGALGQITFGPGSDVDFAKPRLEKLSSLTTKPFGVNMLIPDLNRDVLALAIGKAKVVDFFWGDPDPELVSAVHDGGALASWQVGSVEEAVAAEKAGCDFIIAQGVEAGGHIRGNLGLLPLLTQVLDKVSIPVLAAGGIGSGRSMAAVMAAGASGVRMGTRFIAAQESNAHPDYVRALISAQAEDSIRTNRFEVECPLCPSTHGVLRSALDAAENFDGSYVAEFNGEPVARFRGVAPYKGFSGNIGAMACYAGQSVGEIRGVQPAAEIVHEVVEQAEMLLKRTEPAPSI
jgi:NAD(P)H-dependent flavin oxidoreductase YrpB (nitropropane dioxygenase family)